MLSIKELAKKLNVHPNTIYKSIKEGMPHYKIGTNYRFELEEVKEWLKNR